LSGQPTRFSCPPLLLTPRKRWWVALTATALAHAAAVAPAGPSVATALANRIQLRFCHRDRSGPATLCRAAAAVLKADARCSPIRQFRLSLRGLFGFTTPSFVLSVLHVESTITPAFALLRTMLSNSTAMLLVAPLILLWANFGFRGLRRLRKAQFFEAGALVISLLAVGTLATCHGSGDRPTSLVAPVGLPASVVGCGQVWPTRRGHLPFLHCGTFNPGGLARTRAICPRNRRRSNSLFAIVLDDPVPAGHAPRSSHSRTGTNRAGVAGPAQPTRPRHAPSLPPVNCQGALAHELRQPLASILMNAQTASRLLAQPAPNFDEVRTILKDIVEENKQAANIISNLQSFVRKNETRVETVFSC